MFPKTNKQLKCYNSFFSTFLFSPKQLQRLQNICRPGHPINAKIGTFIPECCSFNRMGEFFKQLIILTVTVSQTCRLVHIFMKNMDPSHSKLRRFFCKRNIKEKPPYGCNANIYYCNFTFLQQNDQVTLRYFVTCDVAEFQTFPWFPQQRQYDFDWTAYFCSQDT